MFPKTEIKKTKPDVDNYLRFYTPVRIGNNVYTVRITAENNKNKNVFNILNADVYDVIIDKKMTTSSTLKNNSSNSLMKSSDNIINDNTENINPSEQISIRDMLKDVKDSDGKTYFQTGNKYIDNSEKYKNLPQDLKDVIDFIYNGNSVYDVTGKEFPKNGESLNERVNKYYKDNFNNVVTVNDIGEVILDDRSIKDSAYHGLSSDKANAFAAVPYVLMNGKKFKTDIEYKGKNEDRYVFAAPITINKNGKNTDYFCEVIVKNTDKTGNPQGKQRFYLHEVELKEKLADVFSAPQGGTSTSSKSIIADLVNKFNPNVTNNEPQTYFQSVYHGSAAKFDRFNLSYVLSGSGDIFVKFMID